MSRLLPVAPVARGIAAVGAVAASPAGALRGRDTRRARLRPRDGAGAAAAARARRSAALAASRMARAGVAACRHRAVGRARATRPAFRMGPVSGTREFQPRDGAAVRPHARRRPGAALHALCNDDPRRGHAGRRALHPAITLAWTLFFVAIAAVSTLLFATAPIVTWSTFANYLSLPLVAVMFAAEHACRRFALPHEPRPRMVDAVRAYRATTHASQPSR